MEDNVRKRDRKPNFTDYEVEVLIEYYRQRQSQLQSKFNTTITQESKRVLWQEIATAVSTCSATSVTRSSTDVRKKWKDLKRLALTARGGKTAADPIETVIYPKSRTPWFVQSVLDVIDTAIVGSDNSETVLNDTADAYSPPSDPSMMIPAAETGSFNGQQQAPSEENTSVMPIINVSPDDGVTWASCHVTDAQPLHVDAAAQRKRRLDSQESRLHQLQGYALDDMSTIDLHRKKLKLEINLLQKQEQAAGLKVEILKLKLQLLNEK